MICENKKFDFQICQTNLKLTLGLLDKLRSSEEFDLLNHCLQTLPHSPCLLTVLLEKLDQLSFSDIKNTNLIFQFVLPTNMCGCQSGRQKQRHWTDLEKITNCYSVEIAFSYLKEEK